MNELHWTVIYVSSRQEKKVALNLAKKGIEHFLPLQKQLKQWSDRKKWVETPLFNGYLFVKPNALQRDQILMENGVVRYLQFEGRDAVVRDDEIKVIQRILTSGYASESEIIPEDLKAGQTLKVVEGPLKGERVEVIRRSNQDYFLVCFQEVGVCLKLELPYHVLSKV